MYHTCILIQYHNNSSNTFFFFSSQRLQYESFFKGTKSLKQQLTFFYTIYITENLFACLVISCKIFITYPTDMLHGFFGQLLISAEITSISMHLSFSRSFLLNCNTMFTDNFYAQICTKCKHHYHSSSQELPLLSKLHSRKDPPLVTYTTWHHSCTKISKINCSWKKHSIFPHLGE